ncbi:hypothetical protein GCM10027199_24520 [Amycolatopsis magusensis]
MQPKPTFRHPNPTLVQPKPTLGHLNATFRQPNPRSGSRTHVRAAEFHSRGLRPRRDVTNVALGADPAPKATFVSQGSRECGSRLPELECYEWGITCIGRK